MAYPDQVKCEGCGISIPSVSEGADQAALLCDQCYAEKDNLRPTGFLDELVTKAAQCSDLLLSDIREAHSVACQKNYLMELLLREILTDAVRLKQRLADIDGFSHRT
jgi:hypothetical protein